MPLTVHYRSGHPSLIALSNELFYNGTLTSFPSAHGLPAPALPPLLSMESAQQQEESVDEEQHGLVRMEVAHGCMESNYGKRDFIERYIRDAVERHCPDSSAPIMPSYSCSPQGFVNIAQAESVFADVVKYIRSLGGTGGEEPQPLSMGVITLNRPQQMLLYAFVAAASERLGLMTLAQATSNNASQQMQQPHQQLQISFPAMHQEGAIPSSPMPSLQNQQPPPSAQRPVAMATSAAPVTAGHNSSLKGFVRVPWLR